MASKKPKRIYAPMITRDEVNGWLKNLGHPEPDAMSEWDRFNAVMKVLVKPVRKQDGPGKN